MIIDFRTLDDGTNVDADLCIIGAGPAGISIAREFIGTGVKICLLESGGYEPEDETQALCEGENIGLPYFDLDATRVRNLGGSSYHWIGQCAPMTPIEFGVRDWVPHSGWPITRSQLDPFYLRAGEICELGAFQFGPENWKTLGLEAPEFDPEKIRTRFWRYSAPTRFGPKYKGDLESAKNVTVYLQASVTNIQAADDGNTIKRVDLRTLDGKSGQVSAKIFVLACGGLDNPRILLASNGVEANGVGNRFDLVGRYFMEHPSVDCAELISPDPAGLMRVFGTNRTTAVKMHAGLCPSDQVQRDKRILNCGMTIEYVPDVDSGVGAAKSLVTNLKQGVMPDDLGSKLWRILADLDEVGPAAYRRLVNGEPLVSGIESMFLWPESEQAPNPDSRVTLAPEKDAVGMNRINLDWRLTELDKHTLRVVSRTIGAELGRLNLGRIKMNDWLTAEDDSWLPTVRGGNHHMGTTRMASDPKMGVVDENCRVHATGNFYIAGSSVFPTSGYVNPTLTIVALALRLADHLKQKFA